ncbi:trichohyalin-like [Papaver somniferum]|uniref:trichohyalin-like n=1 Tax=Papaver somniferum TaxID=3469 RepID=UPI000E6FE3EE|nr:trichohyalin-like [Papaver somniferum]
MGYKDSDLVPSTYNIYGFNGVASKKKGELTVKIFDGELETKVTVCVVDVDSPYNALIGKPWIHGIKGVASTYHQAIWFPMPNGIGEIRGDLRDAKDCITKDVHNYEDKLRKKMEQREKSSEERRAEQLMVFTIESRKELSETQEDEEETNEEKTHIEEDNNATPEEGGHVNLKQGGKAKKGKVAEGNEMTKNKKETPTTKEKQTPREGGKVNRSRSKKAQGQEAEESVEMKNSQSKLKESREEEEMARLKDKLYQERRRKENLVRERIRLERQNKKMIIRNNHLKRKQTESSMEDIYDVREARTKERHYVQKQEGLGRGEQKEREDLKKAIESSKREFREREYRMQQSIAVTQGRNNIPKERRESGLQMVNKCSRNKPCKPEIAVLFSLRQKENESLRSLVARWEAVCKELKARISEEELVRSFIYALSTGQPLFSALFKIRNEVRMKELKNYQAEHIRMEEE